MKTHYHTLFAYDYWACNRMIDCILDNDIIDDRILSLMSHIIWAQGVWMKRIKKEEVGAYTPFNIIALQDLKEQAAQAHDDFMAFIESAGDFGTVLEYKNSRGDAWQNTYEDVLMHVANHGTYHRAQIASRLKEIGLVPPVTDYIAYRR
jgi:uncharacterized damage-inducible protein DinB